MKIRVEENCDIWTVRRIEDDRFFIIRKDYAKALFCKDAKTKNLNKMTECPKPFEMLFE